MCRCSERWWADRITRLPVTCRHHCDGLRVDNGGTVENFKSESERVDRPYRALRISWATRAALRWHARADGGAGLPLGMGDLTTPVLQDLAARLGDACER